MKILICSKLFYPDNSIGAVRPTNFAKYLNRFGHSITVIAQENQDFGEHDINEAKILRISNSKTIKALITRTNDYLSTKQGIGTRKHPNPSGIFVSTDNNLSTYVKGFYRSSRRQIFHLLVELDWFRQARRLIKGNYKKDSFDIVISSYGPFGSYQLGYFVFKAGYAAKWISDIRDNLTNTEYPFWLNLFFRHIEKKMVRNAAAITFVSKGQKEVFRKSLRNVSLGFEKLHIIYNGYEKTLEPIPRVNRDKILRISYSGQLYSNQRDFSMLFEALNSLLEEKLIDKKKFSFFYAGPDSNDFVKQLSQYDILKDVCKDLGYIDKSSVSELQKRSDILVVLTWNTLTDKGILTGKFLEYLQVFRPIISLTSGNVPNGELTEMVNRLNIGIACEYIHYEESYMRLRQFLLNQYNQIQNNETPIFSPKIDEIRRFHYEQITKNLDTLCTSIMIG